MRALVFALVFSQPLAENATRLIYIISHAQCTCSLRLLGARFSTHAVSLPHFFGWLALCCMHTLLISQSETPQVSKLALFVPQMQATRSRRMRRDAALRFSMHLWHIMRGNGLCSCSVIVLCSLCAPTPTPKPNPTLTLMLRMQPTPLAMRLPPPAP